MIEFLITSLIASFVILGANELLSHETKTLSKVYDRNQSGLLGFISYFGDKILPYYLTKPLWSCCVCMSSVWGSAIYYIHYGTENLIMWPVFVLCTAGLVLIIDTYASRL